jgi:hypothetical protein
MDKTRWRNTQLPPHKSQRLRALRLIGEIRQIGGLGTDSHDFAGRKSRVRHPHFEHPTLVYVVSQGDYGLRGRQESARYMRVIIAGHEV